MLWPCYSKLIWPAVIAASCTFSARHKRSRPQFIAIAIEVDTINRDVARNRAMQVDQCLPSRKFTDRAVELPNGVIVDERTGGGNYRGKGHRKMDGL